MSSLPKGWLAYRRRLHARYAEVSNLPDASRIAYMRGPERQFSEAEVAAMWAEAAAVTGRGAEPLNHVYLHVPFCKSLCTFCNYERLRPSSQDELVGWVDRVLRSIDTIAPAVESMRWHTLYVGGGTPSVLPPEMLDRVLAALGERLQWDDAAGRHFEFDPAVMNADKLEVLVRHGFQKFSFGIQTLQADVNAAHNRGAQTAELVARRFEEFHRAGITQVSCDFLLGLAGTEPDQIFAEIEEVVGNHHPSWVDIFLLTPTASYVDKHFGGSYEAFHAHAHRFQELAPAALEAIAGRSGYDVGRGSGHHMSLLRTNVGAGNEPQTHSYGQLASCQNRPLNLLGFGPSARSHILGRAALQTREPEDGGPAEYVGHPIGVRDEAVSFLAHELRDVDTVENQRVQDTVGVSIAEALPRTVAAWAAEGVAHLDGQDLSFTPQPRTERTRSLLWLVTDDRLEGELAAYEGLASEPARLWDLVSPFGPGDQLAPGVVLEGVAVGRLLLRVGEGLMELRIGAPLSSGGKLRLDLLGDPPPEEQRGAVMKALKRLSVAIGRSWRFVRDSREMDSADRAGRRRVNLPIRSGDS